MKSSKYAVDVVSFTGLLITLGIIYGDIGTSPLYVMKAVIGDSKVNEDLVLGGLSCVFWTLTLQTTIKYVILTLRADNNGEGGIFSLFALIRRRSPYLVFPAMIGGSMLLADGIITPPISVSSAIEGLRIFNPEINTMPIVICILVLLFIIQGLGTKFMGNAFGPIMFIWFCMLAIMGIKEVIQFPHVLSSVNPYYAYNLLMNYPGGLWLLGAVFLCTTGAEALYSDLGHCGRPNIRISWIFVKSCLILNYMGQGAWILHSSGGFLNERNPFYAIMPQWFLPIGIGVATMAAIIASQALISGSFTLISEAIRLNLWPKVKLSFPTIMKGQIYVPSINWLMLAGCIGIVMYFKESSQMEAAYGLAINITMIVTTMLLCFYLYFVRKVTFFWVALVFVVYMAIELTFLVGNLTKFMHGGYVTLVISGILIYVMYTWYAARKIKNRLTEFIKLDDYIPLLKELSNDLSIPKYATHLVYLTSANSLREIESKVIYSIFQKQPKRADIYWFLHIDVLDEPYTMEYKVKFLEPNDVIRVDFRLGFRVEHRINLFFRKVVEDLVANKEVDFTSRYTSLSKRNVIGDFRFVVLEKHLSHDNDLSADERLIMNSYFILKEISLSETSAFGLDTSSVSVEKVPLVISPMEHFDLKRIV
ncbi:MAG: KUP/HAK/KT family potassium transporter [Sporocytophaga sp.]|uniref:KUP/HAK/KT family potassium transporter n=1 Tax=Sporocytophaga sp. TaxID=2231183 RepID=UPI001B07EDF3|nr:KUP/HAK/KT family potassium transporter [Sporocytophaga sp.]MBO9698777.1 KUP/HAK/KT family potassium transporter [Sporocytophaga sp.]